MIRAALFAMLVWAGAATAHTQCETITFEDMPYTICTVDTTRADLRLFLRDADGKTLGQFGRIEQDLAATGKTLQFAMNAGMYHADRAPVGLYIENGTEVQRLITTAGPGNFGLVPNGVLCLRDGRADVIETLRFERDAPQCHSATQSGPMLVIDGALHPRFLADGTSKYIRNGVGTSTDGTQAIFAISDRAVNFHTFGRLFRDHLNIPNALYFDGKVSRLHAPDLGRSDFGLTLGPMIGTVVPKSE